MNAKCHVLTADVVDRHRDGRFGLGELAKVSQRPSSLSRLAMGISTLLFQAFAMGVSSFFMGLSPLMFSSVASGECARERARGRVVTVGVPSSPPPFAMFAPSPGKRLKMASIFGMGLLVGAALIVVIPGTSHKGSVVEDEARSLAELIICQLDSSFAQVHPADHASRSLSDPIAQRGSRLSTLLPSTHKHPPSRPPLPSRSCRPPRWKGPRPSP